MSLVVRLFSRSRMRSRSCERNVCSNSSALTTLTSVPASSSRSRSAIAAASSRSSTTPTGVHTPGRRTGPCCRHRLTMTTKSRLPRIVPDMLASRADGDLSSSSSSHSRHTHSPSWSSSALRAAGTIVTPQVAQIGGRSSASTKRVFLSLRVERLHTFRTPPKTTMPSPMGNAVGVTNLAELLAGNA
jgi:hypothetical protein